MISEAWTQDDAVAARSFFNSTTWAKMIEIMKLTGPQIRTGSIDQLAFSGLAKDTWEKCLNAFANFTQDVIEEDSFEQIDISHLDSSRRYNAQPETAKVTSEPIPPNGSQTQNH